ncbi:MAG: DUF5702 domain-containing protein [Clostridiales Family XIII bacterium]|jgi:hypothetical protein|nr:DUF5702 domain-containing protein [Clostridiales Family XIII bacterium]
MIKRLIQNKTGNVTVFLVVAFASILLIASVLFAAARAVAEKSTADAAFEIAGRAILSEYDTRLLEEYGLLAFHGDEERIENDIAFYANATLKKEKGRYLLFTPLEKRLRLIDGETGTVQVSLKEFSLLDADEFEAQIKKAAVSAWMKDRFSEDSGAKDGEQGDANPEDMTFRTLRNDGVKKSLPSASLPSFTFPDLTELNIPSASDLANRASATVLTDEYILSVFEYYNDGKKNDTHFFNNEIEYILQGKSSDVENMKGIVFKLTAFRTIMNHIAILQDSKKMEKVRMIAMPIALALEVPPVSVEAIIIEAWVTAETGNDIDLLTNGKRVAIYKTADQWATSDLQGILDSVSFSGYAEPKDTGGLTYKEHLRILLFLENRETKLARIQDLIQINLKGTYDESFWLRSYYTGFRFTAEDGHHVYTYTQTY